MENSAFNHIVQSNKERSNKEQVHLGVSVNENSKATFSKTTTASSPFFSTLEKEFDGTYVKNPLNDILNIDEWLLKQYSSVASNTKFLLRFESQATRRARLIQTMPLKLGKAYYYTIDFLFHRIMGRVNFCQQLYFSISKGQNQVLSIPEVLGRLVSCGFDIIDYHSTQTHTYVLSANSNTPVIDRKTNHGILIGLNRTGYKGALVKVFKFRTMRPYSEHLQKYLLEKHGTVDGDKIINDFRITGWGKVLRKYWLDELPMLWNLIKGDIKLVGVRPLSPQKFHSYPEHLQRLRVKVKPGLLPPYYADLPKTSEEFYLSEEKYTLSYLESSWKTDFRYLLQITRNILLRGARSK